MVHFDWVWLSTDTQITALTDAYTRASLATKLLGRYDLPDGVAHIRSYLPPWMRMALVFVAEGRLDIGDGTVTFTPRQHRMLGYRMVGVRTDLGFEYSASDLTAIEPAVFRSPVARLFDFPFTRIRTGDAPPLDNFLLCGGGRIALPRIRRQGLELRRELLKFVGKPLPDDELGT